MVGTAHVRNAGVIVRVIYSNLGTDLVNQQLDFARYTSGRTSVVISVGVNHVISLHSPARYERELAALLRRLRARCGSAARIVVCDCPPMHAFPQISYLWPARELFRRYAAAMTAAAASALARKGRTRPPCCSSTESARTAGQAHADGLPDPRPAPPAAGWRADQDQHDDGSEEDD